MSKKSPRLQSLVALVAATSVVASCGSDTTGSSDASTGLTVVVTTNVLGDVVAAAFPDDIEIEVIMPIGADPHDFAPSARQAEAMENADLLVVNGAGFEEGMTDIVESVRDDGTPVFAFADHVDLLDLDGSGHDHGDDEHSDEDHADDEHDDEPSDEDHADDEHDDEDGHDSHDHGGQDPHLWTDPTRVSAGLMALVDVVSALDGVDAAAVEASAADYLAELDELVTTMSDTLAIVEPADRVLVTNHEVFAYFAEQFDFDVVGAVIPSTSTGAEPSASDLDDLVDAIEAEGVRAVFTETSGSTRLADALVDEVDGDVAVVELFTESLGEDGSGASTYLDMMRLDAELIAAALTSG